MRIAMPIDYGHLANAISLNLIAKKLFFELGKKMNNEKSFTIVASTLNNIGFADVNQHFDIVSVPNMGGYRYPPESVLSSKNLFVGLVGIDEVVLGRKTFTNERDWVVAQPIIKDALIKWEKRYDEIKKIHISTESEKEQMMEFLKIPEEKLCVIPLGVDHELFKPAEDKLKTRKKTLEKFSLKDNPYFIHIGEYNWARKNVLRLFEAYRKAKSSGIKQNLIVIGPQGDDIIVNKSNNIEGIIALGRVSEEDLISLLQGADALLNPSLHEGFGLPQVEAMACGIPVITCNIFSPQEVVGQNGLLVDPYDTEDIFNKIIQIANDKNLQETLSKKGIKRSMDFSWEFTASKLLDLFQQNSNPATIENYEEKYVAFHVTLLEILV